MQCPVLVGWTLDYPILAVDEEHPAPVRDPWGKPCSWWELYTGILRIVYSKYMYINE